MPTISIVIPVYNGALTLEILTDRIIKTIEFESHEIILVDDHSTDNSWQIIENIAATNPIVKGFSFAKNSGQQAATLYGIIQANGNYIITIDDDLDTLPEDILILYDLIKNQQYDVVYGCYKKRYNKTLNILLYYAYQFTLKIFRIPKGYSFRVITKQAQQQIIHKEYEQINIDEVIFLQKMNIFYTKVNSPHTQQTKHSLEHLAQYVSKGILFSNYFPFTTLTLFFFTPVFFYIYLEKIYWLISIASIFLILFFITLYYIKAKIRKPLKDFKFYVSKKTI